MFDITPLSAQFDHHIKAKIANKTKPLGALGQLEQLAFQLCKIQLQSAIDKGLGENAWQAFRAQIKQPELIVFAGDHGIAREGVSIAPSEVTSQMVANFVQGGAAINVFTKQLGWQLSVVDAGILMPEVYQHSVIEQRLGSITQPIHTAQAMSIDEVLTGFQLAKALVLTKVANGTNVIAFGEMGIGNTTIASAIMAAVMNVEAAETVGKGTGVDHEVVIKKQQLITQALRLHRNKLSDGISLLACLGGYEIVQITGAMLAAAEQKIAIVVDGFITTAAAMVAIKLYPQVKDYMIFAHCSGEQGHQKMLQYLQVTPLLNLALRLGEGTGAALVLPLLQAAVGFVNDMATFEQAQVDNVVAE